MLLRLKGEPRDEEILAEDEGDLDVDDRADRIPPESVFPEEGAEDTGADPAEWEDDEEGLGWPVRGLAIATATFVPTFVAIVFGLPYLFAPGDAPRAAAVFQPPPVADRPTEAPVALPSTPSETAKQQEEARAAVESTLSAASPVVPPIQPQVTEPPRPPAEPSLPSRAAPTHRLAAGEPPAPKTPPTPSKESRAPVVKEPAVSAPAVSAKNTPPVREAVAKDTTGWTPAAAFADRAAAQRLASGIEQQGYPVEIRHDGSSTRPWVVWIGGQPRSSGGQRRR